MLKKREHYFKGLENFSASLRGHLETEVDRLLTFQDTFVKLREQLSNYENTLSEEYRKNEFLEKDEFLKLKWISIALLDICESDPWKDHVPLCLVAVNYFIEPNDLETDFEGFGGHADDAEVLQNIVKNCDLTTQVELRCEKLAPELFSAKKKEKLSA